MKQAHFDADHYRGAPPENYERYFVPAIGAPLAKRLVAAARLRPGERVLDVACGTGVVARLAARQVNKPGAVAGLDVNPGMLAVARAATPPELAIGWYETGAESIPMADGSFDVVLCQMGLQFFADKARALHEMRRILAPGGRMLLNVPGPTPPLFAALGEAAARHIDPRCAAFVDVVFSLHDVEQIRALLADAGFQEVDVTRTREALRLPLPEDFLWQYVHSTPLATAFGEADEGQRAAVAAELGENWQGFVSDGAMPVEVDITTARATRPTEGGA